MVKLALKWVFLLNIAILSACTEQSENNAQNESGSIAPSIIWQSRDAIASKPSADDIAYAAIPVGSGNTLPADLVAVRIKVDGPGIDTPKQAGFSANSRSGTINNVPVGNNRTITVEGLNSSGTVIYEGVENNVKVTSNTTTPVAITAVELVIQGVTAVPVLTVSGNEMSLNGTWVGNCLTVNNGDDYKLEHAISGSSITISSTGFTSTDGSCSGAATTDNRTYSFSANFTAGNTMAIVGWQDMGTYNDNGNPPMAQDGSGPLSNNESVTLLTFVVTAVSSLLSLGWSLGDTFPHYYYVVDNTVPATPVLYIPMSYDSLPAPMNFMQLIRQNQ